MAFGLRRAAVPTIAPTVREKDHRALLERVDFFRGLDDRILRQLSDAVIERQYLPNEVIIRQGQMCVGLYIILKGRVKVEEEKNQGRAKIAELGAEQFFAEMSLVENKPRSATVTAMEHTDCLLLTRDSFVALMQKYPELPIRVARLLAERLHAANEKLAVASTAVLVASREAQASTAAETDVGIKASVQKNLLETFKHFYSLKAMTRFSVAVLGCPVEGRSPDIIEEIRIGDVKALILPATKPVNLDIEAFEKGSFTLTILCADDRHNAAFGPLPVERDSGYRVELGRGAPRMRKHR